MRAYLARRKYFYAKAINAAVIVALIVAFGGWAAEAFAHDAEVEAQTTSIDVVSGATFTSSGILNGTTEALRQALEGGA